MIKYTGGRQSRLTLVEKVKAWLYDRSPAVEIVIAFIAGIFVLSVMAYLIFSGFLEAVTS